MFIYQTLLFQTIADHPQPNGIPIKGHCHNEK